MSDIFHKQMPNDYLSKREVPKNIWLGVTVENR